MTRALYLVGLYLVIAAFAVTAIGVAYAVRALVRYFNDGGVL